MILIGATSDKIEQALIQTGRAEEVNILHAKTYDEVVSLASETAQKGDIVILSPASTSFDMFRNFEERGNLFKKLVNQLS